MLEHDELLSVEKENPALVRELHQVYQVTSEERQVLSRVHERLASYAYPLPLDEPVQITYLSRSLRTAPTTLAHPELPPLTRRKRWYRPLNAIAGLLFLVLLIGSFILMFSVGHRSSVGSVGLHNSGGGTWSISLVSAESSGTISQQEMQLEATILSQRFSAMGLQGFSTHIKMIHGQPGILVKLPHFDGNERQTINTLLQIGVLDFWNTGPVGNQNAILSEGVTFQPAQYMQYNPGGYPLFTNIDFASNFFSVSIDAQTGHPQIEAEMKGSAIARFSNFTVGHINYGLTITLDGKVLSSANIQSAINGPFAITGNFTEQQAQAVVAILKYGPLPFALKEVR